MQTETTETKTEPQIRHVDLLGEDFLLVHEHKGKTTYIAVLWLDKTRGFDVTEVHSGRELGCRKLKPTKKGRNVPCSFELYDKKLGALGTFEVQGTPRKIPKDGAASSFLLHGKDWLILAHDGDTWRYYLCEAFTSKKGKPACREEQTRYRLISINESGERLGLFDSVDKALGYLEGDDEEDEDEEDGLFPLG